MLRHGIEMTIKDIIEKLEGDLDRYIKTTSAKMSIENPLLDEYIKTFTPNLVKWIKSNLEEEVK